MGRLAGMRAYVSGPMDSPESKGGLIWRKTITPRLQKMGVGVIDPTNKPCQGVLEDDKTRQNIAKSRESGDYELVQNYVKQIVKTDLRFVDVSDFLIVYLDIKEFPCGTYDELFMACNQRKPVLIVCPYGKNKVPGWLWGRIPHELFFGSFDDMFQYLEHIDKSKDIDTLNRWVFIDYKKVFGYEK